jgi:hypothetical protein
MINNIFCALCLAGFWLAPAHGMDVAADFEKANRAYIDGKYPEAISAYIKITQQKGFSANVLFNLGNAYYRNGQRGLAILSYERAAQINPRDPDIEANLKLARTEAGVPLPVERWWRSLLAYFRPIEWAWIASVLLSLFCILMVVRWFQPGAMPKPGAAITMNMRVWRLALVLNGLICFLAAAGAALSMQERQQAVVIAKEGTLLISPYEKSNKIDTLPEGETVNAEKKHDRFIFVRYGKGQGGWIDEKQIGTVDPNLLE